MKNTSILIVEDEYPIALDIEIRLKKLGYHIAANVNHAAKAISITEEENPDLVLMDINLKGEQDGIALAKTIYRELCIPVVFLTAYGDSKTFREALEAQPYGYVMKPFKDLDLQHTIEVAVEKHKAEKEIRRQAELTKSLLNGRMEHAENNAIFIKDKNALHRIEIKNILFLEAMDNYTHIHTATGRYTLHSFLKDVIDKLPGEAFIRVHRSFAIAINKISSIKEDAVLIAQQSVPIGKSYKSVLFDKLSIL